MSQWLRCDPAMLGWLLDGPVRSDARRSIALDRRSIPSDGGSTLGLHRGLLGVAVVLTTLGIAAPAPAQQRGALPAANAADAVTFNKDIAPLLFENCSTCHRSGSVAPFSLLTYDDARPWARAIKQAIQTRSMPPWKPEPGLGGPFVGDRRLNDAQIDLIARWVDTGAPEGNPADLTPPPEWPTGWRLGEPDLVIEMPEPYTLRASAGDVFPKFAIPIPVSDMRYVRGVEFQPRNGRVVHHANMRIDPTRSSRELDERDPEPGYEGVTPFTARYPDGHFLGWTPGQLPPLAGEGMAWRLNPGSDMLLELHLMPSGQPEAVQCRIGFFFTDEAPTKTPFMIRLGKQNLDIPADAKDYLSRDRYILPVDVDVYGVQPHAHFLAREVKGMATLPDGTNQWLINIKDWDFDWQDSYRYAEPLFLPKGTELRMEITFDNSVANPRNPHSPPRRVTFGQKSSNEMGDLWIQVLPRNGSDFDILRRDRRPRELAEDIVGLEMVLDAEPDQLMFHDDVALLYLQFGKISEAVAHFRESARLDPDSPAAQYNLGTTLMELGDLDEAVAQFEHALRLNPDYARAHNDLGAVLRSQGRLSEAIRHFRQSLIVRPDDGNALYNLANALTFQGELSEAITLYRGALELQPDLPEPFTELAWLLATDPNATPGDVRQAVGLAERAAQLTGRQDARVLDGLAVAYAAAGRFDQAAATARAALALLPPSQRELASSIQQRLDLYTESRPYRRPR